MKLNEPPYDDGTLNESGEEQKVAGVLIKSNNDTVFLLLRNDPQPKWSLMSGTLEPDEFSEPLKGLKREIVEELKINPNIIRFKDDKVERNEAKNRTFYYYEGFTPKEFIPTLDHENLDYGWFHKDNLPNNLYEGLKEKIDRILMTPLATQKV